MNKFTWDELQDLNRFSHTLSDICDAREGDCSICPLARRDIRYDYRNVRYDYCMRSELNDLLFKHIIEPNDKQSKLID